MIKKTLNVIAVFTFAFFCTFVSFFLVSVLHAQQEQVDELPTAEDVFDRYAEELGGLMTLSGIESARLTMKHAHVPTFGDDGKTNYVWLSEIGWTSDSISGVQSRMGNWKGKAWQSIAGRESRWLEGVEAENSINMMPTFVPTHVIDWIENADKAKVTGKEKLNDTEVYAIEMEREDGEKQKMFFNIETGLLFAMEFEQLSSESLRYTHMFIKDYREVEGLMVPCEFEYELGQMDFKMSLELEKIEFNGDVDESDLQPPDELLNEVQDSDDK